MNKPNLIIRNGQVIDGTGRPSFRADIAVSGDRIAKIGYVPEVEGAKVIDAGGMAVSPGFIELHTHYDTQLTWDRKASPAAKHGVTTVVAGGCSLSLAPVLPSTKQRISDIFYKIEDLRSEYFEAAVPYSWESFKQYLEFITPGLGINVAPVVGHSALRLYVMGADAQKRAATPKERDAMASILRESLEAGGVGLSSCYEHLHDEFDQPMPAAYADWEERLALARVCAETGRHWVQFSIDPIQTDIRLREMAQLADLSRLSGASVSALGMFQLPGNDDWKHELDFMASNQQYAGRFSVQVPTAPVDQWFQFSKQFNVMNFVPKWAEIMLKPLDERRKIFKELLTDKAARAALHEDGEASGVGFQLANLRVSTVFAEENRQYSGKRLIEIAEAEGRSYTDVMIEIADRDDLDATFDLVGALHADDDAVPAMIMHPNAQIGGSDAGAHIYQMAGEGDMTYMLQHWVRTRGKVSLEAAVKRVTSDLARDVGLKQRGTVAEGNFADLTIFDPGTITRGMQTPVEDVPGGGLRFVRPVTGIDTTIINGQVAVSGGEYTGVNSGALV